MAFNGDGPFNKRMRTDGEAVGQKSNVHYYTDNDYYTPDQNDGDNVSSELMGEACETTGEPNPNGPYGGFSDYDNQPRRRKGEPETPNHVLLMTILNPAYPITVDVIHTICQPYGNVLRIVIFKKNGVQAMVEFDGIDPATRAREGLQGADIYSGCCTLRIEYAKPSKLNVYKNDAESWDFTNPNVGMKEPPTSSSTSSGSSRPPLLQEPRGFGMNVSPFRGGMNGQMGGGPRGGGGGGLFNSPMPDRFGINNGMSNGGIRGGGLMGSGQGQGGPFMGGAGGPGGASLSAMGQPQPGLPQQGAVLMVYGLNKDKMNADRIFNLLCLYGNIVRIKFLKTKEGCAMVQMGDALAVERAVANLNNTTFFGCKMQLGYSKQAFLADVQQPYDLPDGTPSFKDYMGNKNNRFINPEMASKNRIQPPSKILHFFNTPPGLDEETLKQVFMEGEVVEPKSIKLFPSKTERSSSGLLEFNNISEALEALVVGNHAPIPNPNSKFPFIMKLCFSSSRHIPNKMAE
ncbi:heterogeneous nuclear ribonucleoprotein L-like isoform X4 [Eriocheir sinensis]|uniref:heterogeneous nuclear ribonucleoprotein L-like isoform X4 n=1 Tax=Eriocheir sinensis TaxID=95602 RepID=UPI0021C9E2A1|nr:heterogeneous nuclear ribonucleoprotein L-like isoform X4 [Eriocheir sinensis]